MGLATDPFTGSSYAFGQGNPVTNIEYDGHLACANTGDALCPGQTQQATNAAAAQQTTYFNNNRGTFAESTILFNNPGIAKDPTSVDQLTSVISGIVQPGDPLFNALKAANDQLHRGVNVPGCNGTLFTLGACPSETGLAGTTPQQAKTSFIAAGVILSGLVTIGLAAPAAGPAVLGISRTLLSRTGLAAARQAYVDAARAIADQGAARLAAGEDPLAVAGDAFDARNALKALARESMPGLLQSRARQIPEFYHCVRIGWSQRCGTAVC